MTVLRVLPILAALQSSWASRCHIEDTLKTASSPCCSAMPGSKPPSIRGPHVAESSPRDGFPFWVPIENFWRPCARRFPPRPTAPRGVWVAETRSVCAPLRFSFPRSTSRNVYVNNFLRALRRGSLVSSRGVTRARSLRAASIHLGRLDVRSWGGHREGT